MNAEIENLLTDYSSTPDDGLSIKSELSKVKPFTLWKPSQFIQYTEDESGLLLGDGILERGEWTSLGGIGGLGKTRLALFLSICQITSREWCGLKTAGGPQRWLILSTENGVRRYKTDLTKLLSTLTEEERRLVDEHVLIPPLTADNDVDLCLGDCESVARLQATLEAAAPGIIVFDPWADMVDGDENKTEDVRDTLRILRRILQASAPFAAVLIIAHARTGSNNIAQAGDGFSSGNFMRGAKALFSKVRAEIQLAPGDRDDPTRLVMACGKSNNAQRFETRGIIFDPETFTYSVDSSFNLEDWRADVAGKRREVSVSVADVVEAVRAVYRNGEDVTTRAIIEPLKEQTGASAKTIQRRIKEAVEAGYLRDGSKRGTWRLGSKPMKR